VGFRGDANAELRGWVAQWTPDVLLIHFFSIAKSLSARLLDEAPAQSQLEHLDNGVRVLTGCWKIDRQHGCLSDSHRLWLLSRLISGVC